MRAFQCESDEAEQKKIIDKLPKLSILNLSSNKLDAIESNDKLSTCPQWSTLFSNRKRINWTDVGRLITILPQLKELHLSQNIFSNVEIDTVRCNKSITIVHKPNNSDRLCDNEFERMCRLKEIDLKRMEIESNERIRLLQLEKEERVEKFKLELDFKIQMAKLEQTKGNQF